MAMGYLSPGHVCLDMVPRRSEVLDICLGHRDARCAHRNGDSLVVSFTFTEVQLSAWD